MCKKLICLASFFLALVASVPVRAGVFSDDFEIAHDYIADGVEGTGWDGFVGLGPGEAVNALNASIDRAGQLYLECRDGRYQEPWDPLAPFLYRIVSGDFVATVKVTDYTSLSWDNAGVMARNVNSDDAGPGEDWLSVDYFPIGGSPGNIVRSANNHVRAVHQTHNNRLGTNLHPWLQLERKGNAFTARVSADGQTWEALGPPLIRDDFAGLPLQVGLFQAMYSTNIGYAAFDQFRLEGESVIVDRSKASNPSPVDEATDVPREVVLSWAPGEFAAPVNGHTVHFGQNFDQVNEGIGGVTQDANSYTPPQRLDFGRTYYWRVDEVNGPPDHTIYQGDIWQFTVEPLAYPIENVTATASSSFNAATGPENTMNGSGLDDDDLHSEQQTDMWLTSATGQPPVWIQYEFDKAYKLHEMWVWNFNQNIEGIVGFGLKDVTIEYSADGADWLELAGVPEFAQAPSTAGYAHNTTVDFRGVAAKYVKITVNDNWGFLNQYGLSEVRFVYTPIWAREPSPDSGATNLDLDVTLGFRAGREAAKHNVYFGTDERAVTDGTADVVTVTEPGHGPLSLDLGQTYYWRVDEVNEAETPTMWAGDIWDFATQEYLVLEDFEAYDDYEPNRIFDTWTDGWGVPTNGATMGYPNPIFVLDEHFVETTIVHSGSQSTPLFYDNTAGATYSEVTRTVDAPRDWTKAGVKALTLWFYGDPNNPVTEQMYVKLNGSKVTYDGDTDNMARTGWQVWYIDLAGLGVNLGNVTKLTIGLERGGMAGGKGVVYFDDIRLSPYDRQLTTPAEPNPANLVAHWQLDGNFNDSSGNDRHGVAMGGPSFAAGKVGQAINLDGVDDYVNITGYKGISGANPFSLAAWIRTGDNGEVVTWGTNVGTQRLSFRVDTVLRVEHGSGNIRGTNGPDLRDNAWHHVAAVVAENIAIEAVLLYVDGADVTPTIADPDVFNLGSETDVSIGRRATHDDRYFNGQIDEVRIYDYALSYGEVSWLAGRIRPFDQPFRSP